MLVFHKLLPQLNHGVSKVETVLDNEINLLLKQHPQLSMNTENNGYVVNGQFVLNHEYNNIPLYEEYEIKIYIPFNFPCDFPLVWEVSNKIPKNFGHLCSKGELCLGVNCEIANFLNKHPSLIRYIDELVVSYLYAATYYKKYGKFPYGERSHGVKGIMEYYLDFWNVKEERSVITLLHLVCLFKYSKLTPLPWKINEKPIEKDYNKEKFKEIFNSALYDYYIVDYYQLKKYYFTRLGLYGIHRKKDC